MPIQIVCGDITLFQADAIVNAANTSLLGGGGVDGAIHKAAGPELLTECRGLKGCPTGEAKITSAYRLPAKYVIHTPGPVWHGGGHGEEKKLRNCYQNSLLLADAYGCESVAFPSISTGVYRFPISRAAAIALKTIQETMVRCKYVKTVTMVCFSEPDRAIYQSALENLSARGAT